MGGKTFSKNLVMDHHHCWYATAQGMMISIKNTKRKKTRHVCLKLHVWQDNIVSWSCFFYKKKDNSVSKVKTKHKLKLHTVQSAVHQSSSQWRKRKYILVSVVSSRDWQKVDNLRLVDPALVFFFWEGEVVEWQTDLKNTTSMLSSSSLICVICRNSELTFRGVTDQDNVTCPRGRGKGGAGARHIMVVRDRIRRVKAVGDEWGQCMDAHFHKILPCRVHKESTVGARQGGNWLPSCLKFYLCGSLRCLLS